MKNHQCEQCKLRQKFDEKPNSFIGKFWRWHIKFCPGWKSYMSSLDEQTRHELTVKYRLDNK